VNKTRHSLSWLLKCLSIPATLLALAAPPASAQQLTITTGSVGGQYFQLGAALGEYISAEIPEVSTTVIPGGGWANIDRLESGDADIAVVENVLSTLAIQGDSPTGKPYDFRMLAAVRGPSIVQAAIPKSRGITSFEQIAEEKRPLRIATFERAQIVTPIAIDVLAEYGITEEKLNSWGGQLIFTSTSEGYRMINDGVADMWITGGSFFPHPANIELGTREPFIVLPVSKEVADKVAAKYGASVGEVPAGIYKDSNGENEAYYSPMIILGFAVRTTLEDDLVYKIKDALWKHRDEFRALHDQHKLYTPEFAKTNIGKAPLHPGAERWYAEHPKE